MARLRATAETTLLILGLAACSDGKVHPEGDERTITALTAQVKTLESQQGMLWARVSALEDEEAAISCSDKGYSFVPTKVGAFLVSCEDIRTYGDGQKLKLLIGNPHFIRLNGFTLHVRWMARVPKSLPGKEWSQSEAEAWQKSHGETDLRSPEILWPGRWNRAEVVLPQARAEDVGFLYLKMSVDQVSLAGGRR